MSATALPDKRRLDHTFFAVFAAFLVAAVLVGFGPTFYLKPFFTSPPISRTIVWVHGFVMAAWVLLFIAQVYFVSAKKIKLHQKLGIAGVGLAVLVFVVGLLTSIAAAKYGSPSSPANVDRLEFMIVPFGDMLVFALLFGAAIYFRRKPANHKRLMLLLAITLLPAAIARFPGGMTDSIGPLWFYGVPTLLITALIALDAWKSGKLNRVFLFAGGLVIAGFWLRLPLGSTQAWLGFASWITA